MKKLILVVIALFLFTSCEKKSKKEWKSPITENLPDGVIAIEADGDTIWMEDLEQTVDSLEYYMGKYFTENE